MPKMDIEARMSALLEFEKHCRATRTFAAAFFSRTDNEFVVVARGYRAAIKYIRQCICEINNYSIETEVDRIKIIKSRSCQYKLTIDGKCKGEYDELQDIISQFLVQPFFGKREIYINGSRTINVRSEQ